MTDPEQHLAAASGLLANALTVYAGAPEEAALREAAAALDEPLRVAIAGKVKAGKSTLLNALIGERVAATDAGECTRVVTWYSNGITSRAWVVRRDGGPPEQVPFARTEGATIPDLQQWSPDDIARIIVEYPSSRLDHMTLIDTPGIASISKAISQRSIDFLTPMGSESTRADAVLYLIRHLHASDVSFLESFGDRAYAGTAPVNAIGVLSRADEIGPGRSDAMDLARGVAARYTRDPRVRVLVQSVVPVAGLLAQAAATLRQAEFETVGAIARIPYDLCETLIASVDAFVAPRNDVPVDAARRQALVDRMGMFGVRSAIGLVQHSLATSAPQLANELLALSGVPELRRRLLDQFADRAAILKTNTAVHVVERTLRARPSASARPLEQEVERILASAHELRELRLLNQLRAGEFEIDGDELERLEALLGANGTSVRTRLGMPAEASGEEVRAALLRELGRWQRAGETGFGDIRRAAPVARRTCEGLWLAEHTETNG